MAEVLIKSNQSTLSTRAVAKRHQSTTRASHSNKPAARAESSKLLARICKCHRRAERSGRESVLLMMQVGRHLIQVKERERHGEFKQWIDLNCPFSIRVAERYMKLFRDWNALPAEKKRKIDIGTVSFRNLESAIKNVSITSGKTKTTNGQPIGSGVEMGQPCAGSSDQPTQQSPGAASLDASVSMEKLTSTNDELPDGTLNNSQELPIDGTKSKPTKENGSFDVQHDRLQSNVAAARNTCIDFRERCQSDEAFRYSVAGHSDQLKSTIGDLQTELDALLRVIQHNESQPGPSSAPEKPPAQNRSPRASWDQEKLRGRGPKRRPRL